MDREQQRRLAETGQELLVWGSTTRILLVLQFVVVLSAVGEARSDSPAESKHPNPKEIPATGTGFDPL